MKNSDRWLTTRLRITGTDIASENHSTAERGSTIDSGALPKPASTPRARISLHTQRARAVAATTASMPLIPPPSSSTTSVATTDTAPVTSTEYANGRHCWVPSRMLPGTTLSTPASAAIPPQIHAQPGSAPSSAAATRARPPAQPATAAIGIVVRTSDRSEGSRPRPTRSPVKRSSALASPPPRNVCTTMTMKAM